jgi:hypothetical protein
MGSKPHGTTDAEVQQTVPHAEAFLQRGTGHLTVLSVIRLHLVHDVLDLGVLTLQITTLSRSTNLTRSTHQFVELAAGEFRASQLIADLHL